MSFDPFRPDDAGDDSAVYQPRVARRSAVPRAVVAVVALAVVAAAAVVAVLVS